MIKKYHDTTQAVHEEYISTLPTEARTEIKDKLGPLLIRTLDTYLSIIDDHVEVEKCMEILKGIGNYLNDIGGFELMQAVAETKLTQNKDHIMNINYIWDGIGDWKC